MKPNDDKGFWRGVTVTPREVTEENHPYKVTPSVTPPDSDLLKQYESIIQMLRNEWLRVPTKSGRPKKGPRYYAVTSCMYEEELGLTSSADGKGKKWACKTCFSLCVPVWSDGPTPDREEIEQEWADWIAKQGPNSQTMKTRRMLGVER